MEKRSVSKVLCALLIFYCVFIILNIAVNSSRYLWDFKAYYYCAKAFQQGVNPYLPSAVSEIAKSEVFFTYPYPPLTLLIFKLFLVFNYSTAFFVFLFLNCVLIIWLIYLWSKEFLKQDADALFYIFCLLAFNGSIYLALRSGNFVIFEQSLIWLALFLFLRRNLWGFCALIIFAASIKLQPLLFLFMLFFLEHKRKYAYFFYSLIIFWAILALSYLLYPLFFLDFVNFAFHLDERGIINPSTLSLLKDLFELSGKMFRVTIPAILPLAAYVLIILGIVFAAAGSFKKLLLTQSKGKEKIIIFLFCLTYSLVLPRLKDYSYILLLVPTYFIIKKATLIKNYPLYFIFAIIPCIYVTLPGLPIFSYFLWNYYPLIIAYSVWALYLAEVSLLNGRALLNEASCS